MIRTALIAETSVTDFITDCATEAEMKDSGRKIRSGLIATIINIANTLNNHKSEYVQEELNKNEKWVNFVDTELKYSNENNERALAGHQSKTGDSDEESANYETSMDKLFAAFTSLKDSHDSSRELSDSDEEEDPNTDNILEGIDSSSEKSDDSQAKEETKESAQTEEKPSSEAVKSSEEPSSEDQKASAEPTVPLEGEGSEEAVASSPPSEESKVSADEHTEEEIKGSEEKPVSSVTPPEPEEEDVEEDCSYYDNSYWDLSSYQSAEDVLSDA